MNANELADALVNTDYTPLKAECATMLRQQQAEIEALKDCLNMAYDDTMDYIKLNNLGGENNHWLVWARKLLK